MTVPSHRPETPAFVLRGHQAAVVYTDFAPSPANLLVSGDADGKVILWNLHTFFPIAKWSPHPRQVLCCRFLTSDRLLTMGRNDGICIWDTSAAALDSIPVPAIPDPVVRLELAPKQVARMELLNVGFCPCHVVPVQESLGVASQTKFLIACPAADSTFLFDVYLLNLVPGATGSRFSCLIRNAGIMTCSPAFTSTPTSSSASAVGLMIQLHWIQPIKDGQLALMAAYDTGKVVVWGWPQTLVEALPHDRRQCRSRSSDSRVATWL
ncbi:hypothetical protein BCR44DRAFT_1049818 [Catenaria anguillulae PL171]|uniref:Uncharacterized protein n=1 Tax=Catenaria anguillulae PL171 TaxID=765915 RepID=A0A1Y2HQU2_9FUNG|nr:hypothetical protein BCR44DRAFT_1049818 [Catenaria anguillulae PL171]